MTKEVNKIDDWLERHDGLAGWLLMLIVVGMLCFIFMVGIAESVSEPSIIYFSVITFIFSELIYWYDNQKPENNEHWFWFVVKMKVAFVVMSFFITVGLYGLYFLVESHVEYIKYMLMFGGIFYIYIWINGLKIKEYR